MTTNTNPLPKTLFSNDHNAIAPSDWFYVTRDTPATVTTNAAGDVYVQIDCNGTAIDVFDDPDNPTVALIIGGVNRNTVPITKPGRYCLTKKVASLGGACVWS